MASFLTPVSQSYRKTNASDELLSLSKDDRLVKEPWGVFKGASLEEALEALRNQPSFNTLLSVLKYLHNGGNHKHRFEIKSPTPLNAQIIHVLVTEIVPNYWTVLQESPDRSDIEVLLTCLRSLPGINATLTYLRSLIREARSESKDLKNSYIIFNLVYALDLLASLFRDEGEMMRIWNHIVSMDKSALVRPLRHEFLSVFTNGKIVSLAAEAEDICRQAGRLIEPLWVADNKRYIDWLAHSLVEWTKSRVSDEDLKLCAELGARAMRLGHAGTPETCLIRTQLLTLRQISSYESSYTDWFSRAVVTKDCSAS
jgi:telomere length regulation protein